MAASPPEEAAPETPNQPEQSASDGWSKRVYAVVNSSTAFMSLAAKEWFDFLLNQPNDPPFRYSAKFKEEYDKVIRLVVIVIVLTFIVMGSASLFMDKTAVLSIVTWAMWVLIGAFLTAIIYHIFAFFLGVRRCLRTHRRASGKYSRRTRPLLRKLALIWQLQKRRKLTLRQILFSVLYIFVPWIPIFAFLRSVMKSGGTLRGLILIILIYVCTIYLIVNFAKAIKRITCTPWYRISASILLPIIFVLAYILFR
ncbi:MAG: hypothetical protein ICV60_00915 [Pyrinomonadaceae bacterium]|nr:hypothetical protein [Pyrinomonadaceae bacterium]